MSLGGADVAWAVDPLGAMAANPAALGWLKTPNLDLGLVGMVADGKFTKPGVSSGALDAYGVMPEAAFGLPFKSCPITLGISFIPEMVKNADWFYTDPPGGIGAISYGPQRHHSEIIVLRSAVGIGWAVSEKWSIGASAGLIYNDNTLQAPYIFQTAPGLAGAKTLLDLRTDGFGVDGHIGVLYRPREGLQLGLTYKSESVVHSHGVATGDASLQIAPAPGAFRYDAEVENHFPQMVTAGLSWQVCPKWRLAAQADWINWSGAFKELPVHLRNGNQPSLPGSIDDNVPLRWRDQIVGRVGVEYTLSEDLRLRGGYSYGRSPVPDGTVTPLTAVIGEHTVTAGAGWRCGRFQFDLAYQFDLPASRTVATSGLLSGEYSGSRTEVSIHTVALTTSIHF
jgi:long-chain fatty acid transport protein